MPRPSPSGTRSSTPPPAERARRDTPPTAVVSSRSGVTGSLAAPWSGRGDDRRRGWRDGWSWRRWSGAGESVGTAAAPARSARTRATPSPATRAFVQAAAWDLLGRAPTSSELDRWGGRIAAGATRRSVTEEMTHRPEHTDRVVRTLFLTALLREPDAAGLAYWSGRLRAGLPTASVASRIYASPELWAAGGGTAQGFVEQAYLRILGRPGDDAGVTWWTARVTAGMPRIELTRQLFGSLESGRLRVGGWYVSLLGHPPAPADATYWAGRLRTVDDLDVEATLAASAEYHARAQDPEALATHDITPWGYGAFDAAVSGDGRLRRVLRRRSRLRRGRGAPVRPRDPPTPTARRDREPLDGARHLGRRQHRGRRHRVGAARPRAPERDHRHLHDRRRVRRGHPDHGRRRPEQRALDLGRRPRGRVQLPGGGPGARRHQRGRRRVRRDRRRAGRPHQHPARAERPRLGPRRCRPMARFSPIADYTDLRLVDLASPDLADELVDDRTSDVGISADGSVLAFPDGAAVRIWDDGSLGEPLPIPGQADDAAIALSDDGATFAVEWAVGPWWDPDEVGILVGLDRRVGLAGLRDQPGARPERRRFPRRRDPDARRVHRRRGRRSSSTGGSDRPLHLSRTCLTCLGLVLSVADRVPDHGRVGSGPTTTHERDPPP